MVNKKRDRIANDFNIENPNYILGQKRRRETQITVSNSSKVPNENVNNVEVDKRSIAQQARRAREKLQKSTSSKEPTGVLSNTNPDKRSIAQKARRSKEKAQKRSEDIVPNNPTSQSIDVNNTILMNRSSGQLQRRINEKLPKVYEMDRQKPSSSNVGHYPFSNRPGEINTEAGNIISLHGSSSNSDSTHENEVIQPSYIGLTV